MEVIETNEILVFISVILGVGTGFLYGVAVEAITPNVDIAPVYGLIGLVATLWILAVGIALKGEEPNERT
jgi:hypothetical protein